MASTDFPVPAADSVVVLVSVSAVNFAIQCDLTDVTYDRTRTIAKSETFCAIRKSVQNPDIKLSFTGLFNGNANEADSVLDGLFRSNQDHLYKYGPSGSGSGDIMYSGVGVLTQYQIKATAGGNVGITGTLEVNGNDIRTVWP